MVDCGRSPVTPSTPVDGACLEVTAERLRHHLAHAQRRSGGRVDLVPVVGLDDLDVVAFAENPRRHVEQLENDVDADAHVRREDDRDVLRCSRNRCLAGNVKAGGTDDHRHAVAATDFEVLRVASGRVKSIRQVAGRCRRARRC
jgi:hypothetical protein